MKTFALSDNAQIVLQMAKLLKESREKMKNLAQLGFSLKHVLFGSPRHLLNYVQMN